MRDQDSGDCREIKQRLKNLCAQAGREDSLVRIACHELESWYLGDLASVERALGLKGLAKLQNNQKFKVPDNLANASEELEKITKFEYRKVAGSTVLGSHISTDGNKSESFNQFVSGVRRLINSIV